jgi:outer membrane protein
LKRVLAIAVVAVVASRASAQTKLTFGEALSRALEVNDTIERTRQEINLAEATKKQLLSNVLPRVTLTGDLTRNSIEQKFGEGDDSIAILPRNDWAYRVTLSQPVFAGRRELRAYSQAKINVENAKEQTLASEEAMLLRVASSYLAVVNADQRVAIENRNIELAQRRLDQAKAFFEAGEVTKVDVYRAETAMKAAQRMMALAKQQREHAVAQLRTDLDLDGEVEVVPPQRPVPELPDEATLVAKAEASRPEVDIARNIVQIARLEVSKQRGWAYPTVTFDGGWINQKTPFPADSYSYGALRFSVPIFQSGEVSARVAGAKAQQKQAEIALGEAQTGVREDVRRALADLEAANTSMQLANEQLTAAEAEYQQSFELYRAQEATSLDLAASETSLADARRAVAEETLNHDLAGLRVWYAAGALKEAVGVSAPAAQATTTTEAQSE